MSVYAEQLAVVPYFCIIQIKESLLINVIDS